MIPKMHIGMVRRDGAGVVIPAGQILKLAIVSAVYRLAVRIEESSNILPIIVMEQNVDVGVLCRSVRRECEVKISIIVQGIRVKRCQMVNPNAVRPEDATDFIDQGAAATVADHVNWEFGQGVAAQV